MKSLVSLILLCLAVIVLGYAFPERLSLIAIVAGVSLFVARVLLGLAQLRDVIRKSR